tara:strand:+ start:669 stop:1664 length:996 start_codon:yes stop_codon:yes gene_type:complete
MMDDQKASYSAIFSRRLAALLRYYQMGNRASFPKIVEKSLEPQNIGHTKVQQNELTRILYRRLEDYGLIQTFDRRDRWRALGNSLIPLGKSSALIFGDHDFIRRFLVDDDLNNCEEHELYRFPKSTGVDLRLSLPKLTKLTEEVVQLPEFRSGWCRHVEGLLPGASLLVEKSTRQIPDPHLLDQLGGLEFFDFKTMKWTGISSATAHGQNALVRTGWDPRIGELPRFFVSKVSEKTAKVVEIEPDALDWKYWVASCLLGVSLGWMYSSADKTLRVGNLMVVPDLLRRLFFGRLMEWPSFDQNGYIFKDVSSDFFNLLVEKYPLALGTNSYE